jgi:TRAP-type uncharacterized transport system substrate-binding protein
LFITTGPAGSSFQRTAERYRDILSSNGVTLRILPSHGSIENLERLSDRAFRVDIGFVQAGESDTNSSGRLFSLGSISYQPLLIFYRTATDAKLLSDFKGKRLAIGPLGSGTRMLALTLLETNGIVPGGSTTLLDLEAEDAAKALIDDKADAVFLMGDSASAATMRSMLRSEGIQIFDFAPQADAYTRRFGFLNKLVLPRGSIDFAKDVPSHDITLIGPTVELVARSSLHPALSDLLLEAAREVHGNATLLQRHGEFPAPLAHDIRISPDAARYYKSGKSFFYRSLPFWVASMTNRILVAVLPMLLVLIPGLRLIPVLYKWRIQLRIYRWYRSLLRVERDLFSDTGGAKRDELQRRLDHIEKSVNQMKVPASFAGQFYGLREHIGFVRGQLDKA